MRYGSSSGYGGAASVPTISNPLAAGVFFLACQFVENRPQGAEVQRR